MEGNAALRIWIFKALTTARFRHVAYSPAFGEEYEDQLIGHSMNGEIVKSEMKRYITEALMVISRNWKILILRPVAGG